VIHGSVISALLTLAAPTFGATSPIGQNGGPQPLATLPFPVQLAPGDEILDVNGIPRVANPPSNGSMMSEQLSAGETITWISATIPMPVPSVVTMNDGHTVTVTTRTSLVAKQTAHLNNTDPVDQPCLMMTEGTSKVVNSSPARGTVKVIIKTVHSTTAADGTDFTVTYTPSNGYMTVTNNDTSLVKLYSNSDTAPYYIYRATVPQGQTVTLSDTGKIVPQSTKVAGAN